MFPKTYAELKTHIINEYNSQMSDTKRTKIILYVIKNSQNRTGNELSLQTINSESKGKCYLCGDTNHKMKKCWYYEDDKSVEENIKCAEAKITLGA